MRAIIVSILAIVLVGCVEMADGGAAPLDQLNRGGSPDTWLMPDAGMAPAHDPDPCPPRLVIHDGGAPVGGKGGPATVVCDGNRSWCPEPPPPVLGAPCY